MTTEQQDTWTAHMADAAMAVALSRTFPEDRRHWLACASRDLDAAHRIRVTAAVARAEAGPVVDLDTDLFDR